jgi:hypothetical protein
MSSIMERMFGICDSHGSISIRLIKVGTVGRAVYLISDMDGQRQENTIRVSPGSGPDPKMNLDM